MVMFTQRVKVAQIRFSHPMMSLCKWAMLHMTHFLHFLSAHVWQMLNEISVKVAQVLIQLVRLNRTATYQICIKIPLTHCHTENTTVTYMVKKIEFGLLLPAVWTWPQWMNNHIFFSVFLSFYDRRIRPAHAMNVCLMKYGSEVRFLILLGDVKLLSYWIWEVYNKFALFVSLGGHKHNQHKQNIKTVKHCLRSHNQNRAPQSVRSTRTAIRCTLASPVPSAVWTSRLALFSYESPQQTPTRHGQFSRVPWRPHSVH